MMKFGVWVEGPPAKRAAQVIVVVSISARTHSVLESTGCILLKHSVLLDPLTMRVTQEALRGGA